ncbi:hypothetical protein D3C71_1681140 [compost metagenome]
MQGNSASERIACKNAFCSLRADGILAFYIREQLLSKELTVRIVTLPFRRIFGGSIGNIHIDTYNDGRLKILIQDQTCEGSRDSTEIKELFTVLAVDNRIGEQLVKARGEIDPQGAIFSEQAGSYFIFYNSTLIQTRVI